MVLVEDKEEKIGIAALLNLRSMSVCIGSLTEKLDTTVTLVTALSMTTWNFL
jgi:hypothetical protein